MKPVAMDCSRFVAKIIYALKIFMFRNAGIVLTKLEVHGPWGFCIFDVGIYVKSWSLCGLSNSTPANDLSLLKLRNTLDSIAVKGAVKKLSGQLWYLSEKVVEFALLDIVTALKNK